MFKARSFSHACIAWDLMLMYAWFAFAGLSQTRDNLQNQLSELAKQKSRNKEDDSEMTRLEAVLQVARDDLLYAWTFFSHFILTVRDWTMVFYSIPYVSYIHCSGSKMSLIEQYRARFTKYYSLLTQIFIRDYS